MALYRGVDVLEVEPSFDNPSSRYTRSVFRFDSHTGKVKSIDRSGVAFGEHNNFRWMMKGRTQIKQYLDFIDARLGACVPFWVPTWRSDLLLNAQAAQGATLIDVKNTGYTNHVYIRRSRRDLRILVGGVPYYRKVVSASVISESVERLTLDVAMPVAVPTNSQISYLTLARLATDDPKLEWYTTEIAEAVLSLKELPRHCWNAFSYSERLNKDVWTKGNSTIGINAATAPDGKLTADKLQENDVNESHVVYRELPTVGDNTIHTFSCYVKAAERSWCAIDFKGKDGLMGYLYVNLANGAAGTNVGLVSYTIESMGSGWYRIAITFNVVAGAEIPAVFVFAATGDGGWSYQGVPGSGIYVWGMQFEIGSLSVSRYDSTAD